MVFSSVFEKFAKAHSVAMMARALMERALEPKGVNALFRKHAKRQYEKDLLFSTMVDVMARVVCRMQPSVNKAYAVMREQIPVSLRALYAKIDGVGSAQRCVLEDGACARAVATEGDRGAGKSGARARHLRRDLDGVLAEGVALAASAAARSDTEPERRRCEHTPDRPI